jgi:hypothetical protein
VRGTATGQHGDVPRQDNPQEQGAPNEMSARRWREALALTLAEPVLAVCPFSCTTPPGDPGSLPRRVVLAITPIAVRAYSCTPGGDIDATRELAIWNRATVQVTIAPGVVLSLADANGHGVVLHATSDARCDAFIRLAQHPVTA